MTEKENRPAMTGRAKDKEKYKPTAWDYCSLIISVTALIIAILGFIIVLLDR